MENEETWYQLVTEPLTDSEIYLISWILENTTTMNLDKHIIKISIETALSNFDKVWDEVIRKGFIVQEKQPIGSTEVLYSITNPFRYQN